MNELVTRDQNALSTEVKPDDAVLASDIVAPYVVIAQGTSDSVKERKAQLGDIVRSTTTEKLGDPDTPIGVIFLHNPKTKWIIEQQPKGEKRFQYRWMEERNASNETMKWEWLGDDEGNEVPEGTKGATLWHRVKSFLVFAILEKDIISAKEEMKKVEAGELPDPDKALTPVVISFRVSGYPAGKDLVTFYSKAKSMKTPIWRYIVKLGSNFIQTDDSSWYAWKLDSVKARPVAKEDLAVVEGWANTVSRGSIKTDEGADSVAESAATPNVDVG